MPPPLINAALFDAHSAGGFVNPIESLVNGSGGGSLVDSVGNLKTTVTALMFGNAADPTLGIDPTTGQSLLNQLTSLETMLTTGYGPYVSGMIGNMDHQLMLLSGYGSISGKLPIGSVVTCTAAAASLFAPFLGDGLAALTKIQTVLAEINAILSLSPEEIALAAAGLVLQLSGAQDAAKQLLDESNAAYAKLLKTLNDVATVVRLVSFWTDECIKPVLSAVLPEKTRAIVDGLPI